MQEIDIRSRCSVSTNREMDTFVGLRCDDGDISIHFPMGYHISESNKELRKDIMLLFATLAANTKRKESELSGQGNGFDEVTFPLQSYLYVIRDFLARGYYREQELTYQTGRTGKINWIRTIRTQKPSVQNHEIFYLDFVTKQNGVKENELITLIHEYCVYESFACIGWLFTAGMPGKPRIAKRESVFRAVLKEKISHTFHDRNRMLFRHMLAILDYEGDRDAQKNYRYGTCRFEYVWEKLIDKVFGIDNKADYFPKTFWYVDGRGYDNAPLKPDTIMLYKNHVYILDAKYYKYGMTGRICDLPESASVHKQITYGEYVACQQKFKKLHGNDMKVFNAFLMPYDCMKSGCAGPRMKKAGEAFGSWKDNREAYQRVQGILIDVKALMRVSVRRDAEKIKKLAELIEA